MNNLGILFRAGLLNGIGLNQIIHSGRKNDRTKIVMLLVLSVPTVVFAFVLSSVYMYGLAQFLKTIGAFHYYTAFAVVIPWICIFFICLYMMPGYLLEFKDFDLLMALPVRPSAILFSKMLFLYLLNAAVSLLIALPVFVIYGVSMQREGFYYVFALLTIPFLPLIPMMLAALLAYAMGLFSARFRFSHYIMLFASFLILLLFFAWPLMFAGVTEGSAGQAAGLIETIKKIVLLFFPSSFLMEALRDLDAGGLMIYFCMNAVPSILFTLLFSKSFMTIHSKMKETYKSRSFRLTSLKTSRVIRALINKEVRNYFSNYIYVINTAFGMVLVTFFSIVISVINIPAIRQIIELLRVNQAVLPALTAMLTFPVCLTSTTACSVSLDGKTIWLDKSLPIHEMEIFKSKIVLNLAVIVPLLLLNTMIFAFSFSLTWAEALLLFLIPFLYSFLISDSGLLINLYFPKLVWDSPVTVVKQSLSVLLFTGYGFAVFALPASVYFAVRPADFWLFCGALIFVLVIANGWIWHMLKSTGVRLYRNFE